MSNFQINTIVRAATLAAKRKPPCYLSQLVDLVLGVVVAGQRVIEN